MKTVTIFRGCSGSGKTTKRNELIKRKKYNVISYDEMRKTFYKNYIFYPKHEGILMQIALKTLEYFMKLDEDIIIDNTNLKSTHVKPFVDLILSYEGTIISWIDLTDIPLKTLLKNNAKKKNPIDEKYIIKQFKSLHKEKKFYQEISSKKQKINNNPTLTSCKVFDMDGTLALKTSGRSYYDVEGIIDDIPNEYVLNELRDAVKLGYQIIICTARELKTKEQTVAWFELQDINTDKFIFYFREDNDKRNDKIVKEEMWIDISKKFYMTCLYDDRVLVVDHARSLGLNVFSVNNKYY